MSGDEPRSAALLFADELAAGEVDRAALEDRRVREAVASRHVPSSFTRRYQVKLAANGRLDPWEDLDALHAARRLVLGDAAAGPPQVLLRVEDPAALKVLGAVPACVARGPEDPVVDARDAAVEVALRTPAEPDRDDARLEEQLTAEAATLAARCGSSVRVAVPDGGAVVHRSWPVLARRFDVICGGPESVRTMGWHRAPLWRGQAVYLPTAFAGDAATLREVVLRLCEREQALWVPLLLRAGDPPEAVAALADVAASVARPWLLLLAAMRASAEA